MQSKSLYSLDTMRKHRQRHARILRLRKTDHTAGHLLSSTTSMRHWSGGDAADDGFAYSFDDRQAKRERTRVSRSANEASRRKPCPRAKGERGGTCAADSNRHSHGVRSAPRLPSLEDTGGVYEGGMHSDPPGTKSRSAESDLVADDALDGKAGHLAKAKGSNVAASIGAGVPVAVASSHTPSKGKAPGMNLKGGPRDKNRDPLQSKGSGEASGATIPTGSVPREVRQNNATSGSLLQHGTGLDGGALGSSGCVEAGRVGQGSREMGGSGGEGGSEARSSDRDRDRDCKEGEDPDMIFNPLAFPDEKEGVRVLIQASKPLEVLNHAGETWICFIRIMAKDPFDGILDVRIIHDREEVCKTLLSVEEAHKICEAAEGAGGCEREGRAAAGAVADSGQQSTWTSSSISCAMRDEPLGAESPLSGGEARPADSEGDLNELLRRLFAEADTDNKGYLTPEQLPAIMKHVELGLSGPELQLVIAEADENADGSIDYYEFAPMAFNLVHAFRARRRASEAMQDESLDLDHQAIYDLYDAEFERMVRQLKEQCRAFDPNGTGVVSRTDFKRCTSPDRCVGLTKLESKLLLNLMPKDPAGNVYYKKLGAGLDQVRFTTLRNTVAEAGATLTQKYLMDLCREEDAKSDILGNKTHMKNSGDENTLRGVQYSGFLRARQLANLLLNAPLLSLSRLHVTAVMSHAHVEDGMVDYVEAVPMMAKTIEEMFHPRSVRMRHDILKMQGYGEGDDANTTRGATAGEGSQQQQGLTTVSGKSREDIQRIFVDVIREEKEGDDFERLKNPKTFAKCMESLDLGLDSDTINALWETADLNSAGGGSFLDTVDFCFNCALFLEREKQVKSLQKKMNDSSSGSQKSSISAWEAATASVAMESAEKMDPLLALARKLVRHAKVFSQTEGLVDVEFLDDSQIMQGAGSAGGIPRNGDESDAESSCSLLVSAQWSSSGGVTDAQAAGVHESRGLWISLNASCSTASDRNTMNEFLRDQPAEQDIILLARRRVPIVNTIGQGATAAFAGSTGKSEAPPSSSIHDWGSGDGDVGEKAGATPLEASSSHPFGSSGSGMTPGETVDAMITVYWDSCARDRVHITTDRLGATQAGGAAGSPENESASAASNSSRVDWSSTRLTVRVPTIAVVDPQAAVKFAERLAQQVVLGIIIGPGGTGAGQQRQMARLQLDGHDVKAIVERKAR